MENKKPSQGIAIAALLLNILTIPGIGSLVGGKTKTGIIQLIIAVISYPLMLVFIGFLSYFGVWIWGIFTGVEILKEAE